MLLILIGDASYEILVALLFLGDRLLFIGLVIVMLVALLCIWVLLFFSRNSAGFSPPISLSFTAWYLTVFYESKGGEDLDL